MQYTVIQNIKIPIINNEFENYDNVKFIGPEYSFNEINDFLTSLEMAQNNQEQDKNQKQVNNVKSTLNKINASGYKLFNKYLNREKNLHEEQKILEIAKKKQTFNELNKKYKLCLDEKTGNFRFYELKLKTNTIKIDNSKKMILENNSYEYKIQEILTKLKINLNLKTFLPLNDFSAKFSPFLIKVNNILKPFNKEIKIEKFRDFFLMVILNENELINRMQDFKISDHANSLLSNDIYKFEKEIVDIFETYKYITIYNSKIKESIIELALLNIENEIDKNSIKTKLNKLFSVLKLDFVENSVDLQRI